MKRSVLSAVSFALVALPLGLAACTVESTENNTITAGGSAGTAGKAGAAGASAGAGGAAAGSAGASGAAAGSAGASGAAAGSAGASGAAAGSAGASGAAAGSAGAAGAAAGAAGAGGDAGGAGGAAAGAAGAGGDAGGAAGAAAGAAGAGGEAGGAAGAGGSGAEEFAYVRFAHLLAGGPAVDLCLRNPGTSDFTDEKPFFSGNGSAGKFTFTKISVLAKLPAGVSTARVVASGATDCTAPILPNVPDFPINVPAGAVGTFAVGGTVAALQAKFIADVAPFPAGEGFSILGVHANASNLSKIDFGIGNDADGASDNYFVLDVEPGKSDFAKSPVPVGQPKFLVGKPTADGMSTDLIVSFPDATFAADKLAGGDRFNVFYTAPSSTAKDTVIVCAAFSYEDEQTAQKTAMLPDGAAITSLCAKND